MRKNFWWNLFFLLIGVVVGTLFAELTANVPLLSWLSYGMRFGMASPAVIDLHVIQITLGVALELNISVILFVILSLLLGRLILRK